MFALVDFTEDVFFTGFVIARFSSAIFLLAVVVTGTEAAFVVEEVTTTVLFVRSDVSELVVSETGETPLFALFFGVVLADEAFGVFFVKLLGVLRSLTLPRLTLDELGVNVLSD